MRNSRIAALVASVGLVFTGTVVTIGPAEAHPTGIHKNCKNFNNKYPHGVGRRGAHDHGGHVHNFKRSNRIYNVANRHNRDLDGDNDYIACEHH